jgi:acyl-coenzyme A synthetase/AMP-(fatty) acid ligase
VTFVDELPRNATGKVVKRDLEVPRKKRASVPRGH